jgi:hypothetical protein
MTSESEHENSSVMSEEALDIEQEKEIEQQIKDVIKVIISEKKEEEKEETEETSVDNKLKKVCTPPPKFLNHRRITLESVDLNLFSTALKNGTLTEISRFCNCIRYWFDDEANTLDIWANREANINMMETLILNYLQVNVDNKIYKYMIENNKKKSAKVAKGDKTVT